MVVLEALPARRSFSEGGSVVEWVEGFDILFIHPAYPQM